MRLISKLILKDIIRYPMNLQTQDAIPIKSESANVSFYTNNSKIANFLGCDSLVVNERYGSESCLVFRSPVSTGRMLGGPQSFQDS